MASKKRPQRDKIDGDEKIKSKKIKSEANQNEDVAKILQSADNHRVLSELFNSAEGTGWKNVRNWKSEAPVRLWHGVTER